MNHALKEGIAMIELKNIHKSFNDTEVIKGIDLTVDKGEVVTLIGRSGSGKTTLLRMMNALEIPTQGSVFVNGKTYTEKDKNHKSKCVNNLVWSSRVIIYFHTNPH